MLGFFSDSELTHPVTSGTPKCVVVDEDGSSRTTSIYLGDPYTCNIIKGAAAYSTTLIVDQSSELLVSGSGVINLSTVSWTGITPVDIGGMMLTGVTGLPAVTAGNILYPSTNWISNTPVVISSSGSSLTGGNLFVSIGVPVSKTNPSWETVFGLSSGAYVSNISSVSSGVSNCLRIDLQVSARPGGQQEFSSWELVLLSGDLYKVNSGDSLPVPNLLTGVSPIGYGYANRTACSLSQFLRILPINRQVSPTLPGFTIGKYRWRDENTINAVPLSPTIWDCDISTIPDSSFISGIGNGNDLKPLDLVINGNTVNLNIQNGTYFDGPNRFYLPGGKVLEFFSSFSTTFSLTYTPNWPTPIYTGTWKRDDDGFYSVLTSYRYNPGILSTGFGSEDQFNLDRVAKTVTINNAQTGGTVILGQSSGTTLDRFYLPIYPIQTITSVYYYPSGSTTPVVVDSWTLAQNKGQIEIEGIVEKYVVVAATYLPSLAILYETDTTQRQIPINLNPAYSGISSGYLYLENRDLEPESVVLSCDKPETVTAATMGSVIPTVAYGPVLYSGDYALLSATVYGSLLNETVPNVVLDVVPGTSWSGTINYIDPIVTPVEVITSASGVVNMIYTPLTISGGLYSPTSPGTISGSPTGGLFTTNITNDTLVMPKLIPLSEIYNGSIWKTELYLIYNDDPILGWASSGTPGTSNYMASGLRLLPGDVNFDAPPTRSSPTTWNQTPLTVLDENGNNQSSSVFTGNVAAIVYQQAIPESSIVGAYYLTLSGQLVSLQLRVHGTNIYSNTLVLELGQLPYLGNNPWLIVNGILDTETPPVLKNGTIGTYKLGYHS